ncbi:MAG: 4Fe-4S binding protein [candidate division KSB1 bacterium]|nr:4Fe-4S binding protein [candidate division KSB1 bacterium]
MAVQTKIPKVIVDVDECKGCGLCIQVCPKDVLFQQEKLNRLGYHPAAYTGKGCIGCGFCFYQCPEPGAITVIQVDQDVEDN